MAAPQKIIELVEKFKQNYDYYKTADYNEEDLRHDFLNPFFKALGWDMEDEKKFGPHRDVRYEKRIKTGAPDFGFYIDNKRKFFVEAKKPSVNVCDNPEAALQLRSYGWSAKTIRSILTDFEELAIYDCLVRPKNNDGSRIARLDCIKYEEYIERWDEIAAIFSRDAVLGGSLERLTKKRAAEAVDDGFLEDISRWREMLARNVAVRNEHFNEEQVNRLVQDMLDRIIFLRICEDRDIEGSGELRDLAEGPALFKELQKLFKKADQRYDSGLFRTEPEKEITIDDATLKTIINELYFPLSPYKFDAIPADILGHVYEQFLGKVIRLTDGHHAKIEEKPEVRKAGGVYYTPTYIVEYIVENTVGKLLEDKSPKEIAKLSVLDPACGSGSFLIGAYQYLMDWYRDWYASHDSAKHEKKNLVYQDKNGIWQLTLPERKRILTDHIYGVDIDRQAVEVAKLSLMLKTLEVFYQKTLFAERLLPELENNIKCGNSLIGTDYFANQPNPDAAEMARTNPFDWEVEFPEIFKRGGFDAVVGNPPYSSKQSVENKRLATFFHTVEYKCDPFAFFIERGLNNIKQGGLLGYIIPVSWMTNYYYGKLREHLIDSKSLTRVVMIDGMVFDDANVDTCLIFLNKESVKDEKFQWAKVKAGSLPGKFTDRSYADIRGEERYDITPDANPDWSAIKKKVDGVSARLKALGRISLGMKLKSNKLYVADKKDAAHPDVIYFGNEISRYGLLKAHNYFDFKRAIIVGGTKNIKVQQAKPKILIQAIRNLSLRRRIVATIDSKGKYFVGTLNALVLNPESLLDYRFVLGVLNSTLLNEYFRRRFTTISLTAAFIGELPVCNLVMKKQDNADYEKIIGLVDRMLLLNEKVSATTVESEQLTLQRQVAATDLQIDQLVYKLYGLTEEEIKIVEAGS